MSSTTTFNEIRNKTSGDQLKQINDKLNKQQILKRLEIEKLNDKIKIDKKLEFEKLNDKIKIDKKLEFDHVKKLNENEKMNEKKLSEDNKKVFKKKIIKEQVFNKTIETDFFPNELNISIECIADCLSNGDQTNYDLEERCSLLESENQLLKAQNQKLTVRLEMMKSTASKQKQQNLQLACHLQNARLKIRDNQNSYVDLTKEYYKQYDIYDKYHRHSLTLTNFIDLVVHKLSEFDANLTLICRNRFIDFDNEQEELNTIDHENVYVLEDYLKRMQLKIDNLLLDSD